MTIKIEFSKEDIDSLMYQRFHHPHPRVQQKMEALLLKSKRIDNPIICEVLGICPNTLRTYFKQFQHGGVEGLKEIRFYKPKSDMEEYKGSIENYFKDNPPASIKEAASVIERLTGIKRSTTQTRKFLLSIGMKLRKVGTIPAKADYEAQSNFLEKEMEPRIKEAELGQRKLLFLDAAHFVMAPFLGFLWCFVRVFIPSPSGRKRFNVLGAIDAVTHKLIAVTNDSYINAMSVCELLKKVRAQYLDIPVTIILDNARYQKCAIVKDLAKDLQIELLYLPAYSPNLNLIERLWKFVKKKCLYSKYYENFGYFKASILECLEKTETIYKEELDSLLRPKFQTFEKTQVMAL